MDDVELRLPPDVRYVGLARLVVCAAARQAGMDDERVEDLRIAVSEATTNAVVAHQRHEAEDAIVLTFGPSQNDAFAVCISDAGPGFEPISPEDAELRDWSQESGLGVTLIRNLADDVDFVRGAGMQVQMRFAVSLGNASA